MDGVLIIAIVVSLVAFALFDILAVGLGVDSRYDFNDPHSPGKGLSV